MQDILPCRPDFKQTKEESAYPAIISMPLKLRPPREWDSSGLMHGTYLDQIFCGASWAELHASSFINAKISLCLADSLRE